MSSDRASPPAHAPVDVNATRLAWKILLACLAIELAFVVADYVVNYGRATSIGALRRMFNTAREDGLASWFAVTQTLFVALTLWLLYVVAKRTKAPRWKVYSWLVVALFFTYMAIDDGAQIHERLGTTFERLGEDAGGSFDFFPSYTWQVLFLPVFAALGVFMFGFLWFELGRTSGRVWLVVAISCLATAIAMDFVEGLDDDHPYNVYAWLAEAVDLDSWSEARFGTSGYAAVQHFSRSFEEALEMAAHSILWFLFIRLLGRTRAELHVRFGE